MRISIFIFIYLLFINTSIAENQYPIVLIHGFMGWGTEEMSGYKYWGGKHDFQEYLESFGHEVYTVSIGPISSNWDRAIEAYYQIKGGQVDYGKRHSDHYKIIQKPKNKNWDGLYPKWDSDNPIHIIGHSMGGQTARMLQFLLENQIYSDSSNLFIEESDLLRNKKLKWIRSITTISTPHNGTTLSNIVTTTLPFMEELMGLASIIDNRVYSFDLEQWGFSRRSNEPLNKYIERLRNHPAWKTKNFCAWDVSIDGAMQLNTYLKANNDIYYFSYATGNTSKDQKTGFHKPNTGMSIALRPNAYLMGKSTQCWLKGDCTDSTWYENDGIVNTISQLGPISGEMEGDKMITYMNKDDLATGVWLYMGKYTMDHKAFMGHGNYSDETINIVRKVFNEHSKRLKYLPAF
jgi:triacylglycerol lipase